ALRRRADRRRRTLAIALRVVAAIIVVAAVAAVLFGLLAKRAHAQADRGAQAQSAARAALTTMLTADPRNAGGYVDSVLAVTTGEQHRRLAAARGELAGEISRQTAPSTGQVLATALVGEPSSNGPVEVLVVAEATNPQLIGAATTEKRVPVVVTMTKVDGRWLVEKARQA
ncbi:hypothetical protein, partial [Gordonia sp. (in: high G+C Gram-positive bacteria)]|uniref:hypothetical protein n=1 Tax=Gordonia sp. (in: high G+C Gram-positive bacteria) TaxID=84139 RepID=UPI0039E4EAF7